MRVLDQPIPAVSGSHPPLTWPADLTIAIEQVAVESYSWDDMVTLWDDPENDYLWDHSPNLLSDFVDATCDVQGLTLDIGTPDPQGKFEAGQLTLTLKNESGEWSQYDSFGRLVNYPIGRRLCVWAELDGEDWWLFSGYITAWRELVTSQVEVEAFDAFTRLNAQIGKWTPGSAGQRPRDRLEAICALISYTAPRRFDLGDVTLRSVETERSVLEEMQQIALSDGGALVVDADGTLLYRNRAWPTGRTDQTAIPAFSSNECGAGHHLVWEAVLTTDDEAMVNLAVLANTAEPPLTVSARNEDSISLYGELTLPEQHLEDQWTTTAEGQALADFIVQRRGDAYLRLESFQLYLHDPQQDLWRAGIDLRIGDILEFLHSQPAVGGTALLDLYLIVASIRHEILPDSWLMTVGTTRSVGNRVAERWDQTSYVWDDLDPRSVWSY